MRLTENSTPLQKKNFLKTKASILLSETMRQNDMKYKMYTIIDEMYQQVEAGSIDEVLSPNMISDIITEAFAESLDGFISVIRTEISESAKPKKSTKAKMVNESIKPKVFLKKNLNESDENLERDLAHFIKASLPFQTGGDLYYGQNVSLKDLFYKQNDQIYIRPTVAEKNHITFFIVSEDGKNLTCIDPDNRFTGKDKTILSTFNETHKTKCEKYERRLNF